MSQVLLEIEVENVLVNELSIKMKGQNVVVWTLFVSTLLVRRSHWLFSELFPVADDVRHAVFGDCNLATINPLAQNCCSSLVVARLTGQGVQLLLKVLDALGLLFDLLGVLAVDCFHDLLSLELVAHLGLPPPSLAAGLEDVDAAPLGRYDQKQGVSYVSCC